MYFSLWFPFVSNLHLTLLVRGHASSLCSLLTDKMRWSDTCSTCPKANFPLLHHSCLVWWPTTVTAKPKTSRETQKHHVKTKNLTAKTKYLAAKTKTSRQNQMLHSKSKIAFNWFCRGYWLWPWGICMVFAVYLVLPWGLWFCREVFGFVVSYFVFAVRFLVLPWKLWATVPFVPESLL